MRKSKIIKKSNACKNAKLLIFIQSFSEVIKLNPRINDLYEKIVGNVVTVTIFK